MTRTLGTLALLAGCQQVFGLDHVETTGDGSIDATGDGGRAACAMPVVSDTFESGSPCATWGYPFGTAALAGGDLVLAPSPQQAENIGCVSQVMFPFGDAGIFIAVDAVGTGDAQFNTLILWWEFELVHATTIQLANDAFLMADRDGVHLGSGAYDPVAMRWIRLRPTFDRTEIIGEASPDGVAWQELGRETRDAPAMIRAQIQSGTNGPTNATAMRVASFDVCP